MVFTININSILMTEDCAEAMRTAVVVNLDNNTVITPIEPMNENVTYPEALTERLRKVFTQARNKRGSMVPTHALGKSPPSKEKERGDISDHNIDLIRVGVLTVSNV